MSEAEENKQDLPSTFSQLVIMIATSALQQLGQIPDPSGKRPEVHLEGAQGMIDILETLNEKTKGNLDTAEEKMLSESLTMLRLQFVEVKQAQGGGRPSASAPTDSAPLEPAAPAGDADQEPVIETPKKQEETENKTRYRKSYG